MVERATFAAGCFWGVESTFRKFKGIIDTKVGYTGGTTPHPTYEQVCSGKTGHAEAVEILFDPKLISYSQLLDHFWKSHNPTQKNRQGPDIGTQYRSAIFYHTPEQQRVASASKEALLKAGLPIVTEIVKATIFYPAEEYHQRYHEKHGGSCSL